MPPTLPTDTTPSSPPLPPRVRDAVDALHAHLSRELDRAVEGALNAAHRDLFQLGERSTAPSLQAHWMTNLQRLFDNRYRLLPRLLQELRGALGSIRDLPRESGPAPAPMLLPARPEDMRLVEDTDPDEPALLDELERRQESRAGLPLLLLGQRFGVLAAAPARSAGTLPVGPRGLASMFMRAVDELHLDTDARKVVLRAFEREVMSGYLQLAESMNSVLDRSGILPGLSFVPLRPRPAYRAPAPVGNEAAAGTGAVAPGPSTPATPASANRVPGAGDTDGRAAEQLHEAQRLAQMRQWMSERRHLLTRLSGSSEPRPTQPFAELELDNVLAALQVGPPLLRSPAALRQSVLEQAGRLGSTSSLGDGQADALALFGTLYARLQEHTDSQAHGVLAGLQLPLLRRVMHDPGFLVQASAPSRQLLATVAEAGAGYHGPEGLDAQVLQRMQEVVNTLALQYPHEDEVFTRANAELEEPLQAAMRRAELAERRNVEAARGRERLLSARRNAVAAIDWALGERETPRFQRTLLEQAWADALALVALRNGTGSRQWHEYIETTAAIGQAIHQGVPADPLHAERTREALGLIGYHPEQATAIAAHLTGCSDPGEDPASRTELVLEMKERSRLGGTGNRDDHHPTGDGDEHNGGARTRAGERDWEARLQALPDGHWLSFDAADRPGGRLRLRLAWHGADSGRVLLLTARGQPPAEPPATTLRGLGRLLAAGKARLLGEAPAGLFDLAWRGLVDELVSQSPPLHGDPDPEPRR